MYENVLETPILEGVAT